ncbi:ATP-binding protein [Natronomonas salina]|uniref:ATP-binding protein n=1 Tax=Natronomonas salina TaxID=1710540 RepID=UPI0015B64AB3|nr:ATP-binding protein [Natronomonas salina]QLD88800.1 ATP-binding protein [Natronomonas salina]
MIDREREREWLASRLTTPDQQMLVIYGRRRVGKTTLVTEVLDDIEASSVYYLCDQRSTAHNAGAFAERCAEALDDVPPAVDEFEDVFEYLVRRVDGPFVVALDEFSSLVDGDDTIPSVFQRIIDEVIADTDISLVLLGSSISMMEEGVLSYESPLYGRQTGQWRLEPLTLGEAAGFFPETTPTDLVRIYSVLGGIPAYLEQFDPDRSLAENVERTVLSKGAFLYEEPEFLLRQELRNPTTYMSILEAIASGATRVTEIADEIGKESSSLSRYLQNLTRLALVERETPVTDPDGRGMYRLTDQYLRFWFRYAMPNRATLEQGDSGAIRRTVMETFPTHASWTFRDVCRQAVRSPSFPVACSRVGRWWYDEHEVDVAGVDEETETLLLGACKWTADPVDDSLLTALESIEPEVRWRGDDRSIAYALFSKAGFTEALRGRAETREDLWLFTPADVLELTT